MLTIPCGFDSGFHWSLSTWKKVGILVARCRPRDETLLCAAIIDGDCGGKFNSSRRQDPKQESVDEDHDDDVDDWLLEVREDKWGSFKCLWDWAPFDLFSLRDFSRRKLLTRTSVRCSQGLSEMIAVDFRRHLIAPCRSPRQWLAETVVKCRQKTRKSLDVSSVGSFSVQTWFIFRWSVVVLFLARI